MIWLRNAMHSLGEWIVDILHLLGIAATWLFAIAMMIAGIIGIGYLFMLGMKLANVS
jgi:hypothetical protein